MAKERGQWIEKKAYGELAGLDVQRREGESNPRERKVSLGKQEKQT